MTLGAGSAVTVRHPRGTDVDADHTIAGTTLLPGTVILTGTPQGVGAARKPPVFLKPGDTVTVEINKIGALTNPVVAEE